MWRSRRCSCSSTMAKSAASLFMMAKSLSGMSLNASAMALCCDAPEHWKWRVGQVYNHFVRSNQKCLQHCLKNRSENKPQQFIQAARTQANAELSSVGSPTNLPLASHERCTGPWAVIGVEHQLQLKHGVSDPALHCASKSKYEATLRFGSNVSDPHLKKCWCTLSVLLDSRRMPDIW